MSFTKKIAALQVAAIEQLAPTDTQVLGSGSGPHGLPNHMETAAIAIQNWTEFANTVESCFAQYHIATLPRPWFLLKYADTAFSIARDKLQALPAGSIGYEAPIEEEVAHSWSPQAVAAPQKAAGGQMQVGSKETP